VGTAGEHAWLVEPFVATSFWAKTFIKIVEFFFSEFTPIYLLLLHGFGYHNERSMLTPYYLWLSQNLSNIFFQEHALARISRTHRLSGSRSDHTPGQAGFGSDLKKKQRFFCQPNS